MSCSDRLVKALVRLRNTAISHTAFSNVQKGTPSTSLPTNHIATLLNRARDITSRYSLLFRAKRFGSIAGAQDYKSTLRWVQTALDSHAADIDEQIKRAEGIGTTDG